MTTAEELPGVVGDIARLLVTTEAEHHARGWGNNDPTVYRVDNLPAGGHLLSPIRLGVLVGAHPRDELRALAQMAGESSYQGQLRQLHPTEPIAHIFIGEGWVNYELSAEERRRDGRRIGDIPGSVEARFGLALVGRRTLGIRRNRTQPPVFEPEAQDTAGGMWTSLREFHVATLRAYRVTPGT